MLTIVSLRSCGKLIRNRVASAAGDQVNGHHTNGFGTVDDEIPASQHTVDIDKPTNFLHRDRKPPLPITVKVRYSFDSLLALQV